MDALIYHDDLVKEADIVDSIYQVYVLLDNCFGNLTDNEKKRLIAWLVLETYRQRNEKISIVRFDSSYYEALKLLLPKYRDVFIDSYEYITQTLKSVDNEDYIVSEIIEHAEYVIEEAVAN